MSKLYFLNYCYYPNSAEINRMEGIVRRFSDRGICLTWVFIVPSKYCDRVAQDYKGVTIKYLWSDTFAKSKVLNHIYTFISFLCFLLQLNDTDTIYVYGCYKYLSMIKKRKLKIYHETTEHPKAVISSTRHFNYKRYLYACSHIAGVFVISQNLREYFIQNNCDRERVHIINMTVDSKRFEGLIKEQGHKYIAYCGNGSLKKDGVDDLIKAFAVFSNKYQDYKLMIIGKHPDIPLDFWEEIKIINIDILEKVCFMGIIDSSSIPQLLKNASILALARPNSLQAQYGFPTKLGEYLLTGNPVVATSTGEISYFLEDGISALLCEDKNPVAFASKLEWAVENPSKSSIIGQKGKQVAMNSFNSVIEADKIIGIINPQTFM